MIQKKICMLGSFGVGKTSLVRRFVSGQFSEKYLTTVGVKVDRHPTQVDGREIHLLLWDIHGDEEHQRVRATYLRGSAGCMLVADGTRPATIEHALQLRTLVHSLQGKVPMVLAINKSDLRERWSLDENLFQELRDLSLPWVESSAKTGAGVQDLFSKLAQRIVET